MSPTSPRQVQIDPHLPSGSRAITIGSPSMSPSRALAPSIPQISLPSGHRSSMAGRSFREDSEEARQRQMAQDLESAMSMSRARSGSLAPETSPALTRPSMQHYPSTSPIEEGSFPMLSDAEEAEMDRARSSGFRDHEGAGSEDGDGHGHGYHRGGHHDDEDDAGHDHRSSHHGTSQGSRLLRRHSDGSHSHGDTREDLHDISPPDMPGRHHSHLSQGHSHLHPRELEHGVRHPDRIESKSHFDFKAMEEYGIREREALGVSSPGVKVPTPSGARHRSVTIHRDGDDGPAVAGSYDTTMARTNTFSAYGDDADTNTAMSPRESEVGGGFARRRQRKLSQSNPVMRRGGKLALFEGFGGGNDDNESVLPFKQPRGQKNALPTGNNAPNGFQAYTDTPAGGHDKPYRFSFYSNALPVTIHARTLAELPAEGQTFEDLFKGKNAGAGATHSGAGGTEFGSGTATPDTAAFNGTTAGGGNNNNKASLLTRAANAAMMAKGGGVPDGGMGGEEDPEAFTWWLDVQSPTDEEMRMLSKVFGIHPLTTEDILLEETREKIELFRNYYLVCFRSFDQDPYSQTYLEPLNMYIIVFREGTLSFHFRGTPHPQNVRRRIKHLKDYISVTSDWISYALIDDITDAFGPLIQSIEYEVDSIDELVLILKDSEQSDMLRRIGTCRKKVMGLLRLMGNKADVVKGLAKRCNEQWLVAPKSDIGLYLSDIQDHLITMTQNLNHYEKILSRSHSNYLAQISIEMTDANNQINDVLSKLTALGTVLIPMNLVTGLWGMNVHVPGQDITEGYAWFGGILGCLCAFAVLGAFATYKCFVRT